MSMCRILTGWLRERSLVFINYDAFKLKILLGRLHESANMLDGFSTGKVLTA